MNDISSEKVIFLFAFPFHFFLFFHRRHKSNIIHATIEFILR